MSTLQAWLFVHRHHIARPPTSREPHLSLWTTHPAGSSRSNSSCLAPHPPCVSRSLLRSLTLVASPLSSPSHCSSSSASSLSSQRLPHLSHTLPQIVCLNLQNALTSFSFLQQDTEARGSSTRSRSVDTLAPTSVSPPSLLLPMSSKPQSLGSIAAPQFSISPA